MLNGCLGRLGSAAFLCCWILLTMFYVGFGPANWLLGFGYGVGMVAAIAWLGKRWPMLVSYADIRTPHSNLLSGSVQSALRGSDAPRANAVGLVKILCWALAIVFGGLALLFAVFTAALAWRNELTSDLTGASIGCGFFTALTYAAWNLARKVDSR